MASIPDLTIRQAQRIMRQTYAGGFHGQVASGAVWLVAATALTWVSPVAGAVTLLLGGTLIFPRTTLGLRFTGSRAFRPTGHPLNALTLQIALTVPLGLLVVMAVGGSQPALFLPAGMRLFGVLAGVLVSAGLFLLYEASGYPLIGPWLTGVVLVLLAVALRFSARAVDASETRG